MDDNSYRFLSPRKMFKRSAKMCASISAIPGTKLDEINDDCLAHIFKMLDIYDLYNIACASPRFESVFSLFKCNFAYTVTNVAAPNLKHFLQMVGMQIRTLSISISERNRNSAEIIEFLECVQEHCLNVKHLAIKKWPHLNFSRFSTLLKRLESLRLDECEYTEINDLLNRRFVIKPWIAQPLSSMQLALQKSSGMSNLTNLTCLKLHRCKGFRPNSFQKFLMQNNKLIELSLFALKDFMNSDADESFFDGLVQYMQCVETISIDVKTTSHIQFIARLPRLRSLQLLDYSVYNDRIVDRLLRKLSDINKIEELDLYHCNLGLTSYRVVSQFQKLHTLKLRKNFWVTDQHLATLNLMQSLKTVCCFDNIVLTDDGVMSLVRMSPQLTQLDCSWCFQVTNRTVHDIQYLLHHQSYRPKLDIIVGGRTKITESVLNDISGDDVDRISIKFDPNMSIDCIIQNSFCLNCTSKSRSA
ncbi:uncharacterized protein LOC129573662 [Sitodiplosis mosellana]|uniref:uncharacterized protein LOC129573662 n=1 Tax=Sitodiplosis mosellana TaxID=263140 RepID=UPI0024444DBF|nr:uncharacterized protein LOC129573662 [Sitodiplosis mosellana]XP_055310473.1 uncharacterized protein LOC129573662 [Sitodiplosis mosellana]XP_055310474.1 uncharacterized protein LOC129573662 [Sitodiplosis mosellana]